MVDRVRTVDFLPEIFQTPVNRQFLNATLDQLVQEPSFKKTQGYVGRRVGPGVNPADRYVIEPTKARNDYQLEPGVIEINPENSKEIVDAITYPGITDALKLQGADVSKADRLYTSEYYAFDPFVDLDKFTNFSQYYWLPSGPDTVDVFATTVPIEDTIKVTRENGVYKFSSIAGDNPTLTLVRGGNYNFDVAQNEKETINFRVTNNSIASYVIDYQANPTLTLARGNTYTFNLSLNGVYPFYIKTIASLGDINTYDAGVLRNGASTGTITFTVPQDAPDTLYYASANQFNMRGQINIVDGTPGTGPGFWIQTDPGVNGRLPYAPNLSSRDVLGVINNGEDLGTVRFDVPYSTAQSFYYTLNQINPVDLICTLKFNQINNIFVSDFLQKNPDGIDGITNLNGRTLVFINDIVDADTGGWQITTQFDPLLRNDDNNGKTGSFDSIGFDQTTNIDSQTLRYSVWQIQYKTDTDGSQYIELNSVTEVAEFDKFNILFGNTYSSTSWYKDAEGFFEQIPLLSAIKNTLYYQDGTDPEIVGQIHLIDQNENATINIDEIIGQTNYISPNGVVFTNGLKIVFRGTVEPASYSGNEYYVEGVGTAIRLLPVSNFVTPETYTQSTGIPYDSTPYDVGNYDATLNSPVLPDYLTINRASPDLNAWTRSNRWFHIDVINASAAYNNSPVIVDNLQRGRRPILEFRAGTKLFDFGTEGIQPIDIIDFSQTDALSNVNGSLGYGVDGYTFIDGTRVIFAADVDPAVRNQVYVVNFITPTSTAPLNILNFSRVDEDITLTFFPQFNAPYPVGSLIRLSGIEPTSYNITYTVTACTQTSVTIKTGNTDPYVTGGQIIPVSQSIIDLVPAAGNPVLIDQSVVCLSGVTEQGNSYYYDGVEWIRAQQKSKTNQAPLFDVYDSDGISFSNKIKYPSSNFIGSKLFSYTAPSSAQLATASGDLNDPVLGFQLSYLSLSNVGDIIFDNNLYKDSFTYARGAIGTTLAISSGFVREYASRLVYKREIGWQTAVTKSLARQQFQFSYDGKPLLLDVKVAENKVVPAIQLFVNAAFLESYNYRVTTTDTTTTITLLNTYAIGDVIEVDVLSDQASATAFYQVPTNLSNNPLNSDSGQFTLGTIRSHYGTICQNLIDIAGPINGANNTRDLGNIIPYGQQILQQSAPMTLAGYFMRSKQYDIFAALDYNSREYIKFKSKLLEAVVTNDYGTMSIPEILDAAIADITLGRSNINPFYWSDMLPTGPTYTQTATTVTAITTSTFNTVQTYDFTYSNYLGLLVYLTPVSTGETVLLERDFEYTVSTDSPRITITVPLNVGDVVTIREYSNTAGNFVPNTPTKLGLYPKFLPKMFYDLNYVDPVPVIQGHDGSITVAFNDYRDEILLEFEKRIYNNLKTNDNPIPLLITEVMPGFFRTTDYTQTEITNILGESFLSWVGWNKLDYKAQDYVANNPFTYNYSAAGSKLNEQNQVTNVSEPPLLGAWRGIYRYFYDTISPNYTPWEMLGFSEQPTWWLKRYGPAPYTSDNLVLWDDLAAGYVADPVAPYYKPDFARPNLQSVIPVGSEGQLLNPLESVVGEYDPTAFRKSWQVGDGGPVEASWWSSSSYPYAVMRLLALTRPAEFFSLFADRDDYRYNVELGQYLFQGRYRLDATGVPIYGNGTSRASYIDWIVDYNQQLGLNSTDTLTTALANLDVRLCYRMASFTDKQYLSVYTERSSPNSLNSSLLLPDESYNLLLYKNQPFSDITYSALIIERVIDGYAIYGYSTVTPYFQILVSSSSGIQQTIEGGGALVRVPAQYTNIVTQIPYGYTFTNTTVVVDFILSYGKYLESQGLVFSDQENGYTLNWNQMASEFLYFSTQGWDVGTMINLNPVATTLKAYKPGAVVDTIVSMTPENMLLDQNRGALDTRDLVVVRDGNDFTVTSTTNQTISFLQLRFTNYENMVVLDNVSIFQDLIYDPVTAARQSRVKVIANTTTDWIGELDAQGFILNQNNVKEWQPYEKYTKGQIVLYKNQYWQAMGIIQPKATFDFNDWVKSNYSIIQKGLLPNIANKADQLANSYNINTANLERDNDLLAYGLIGFRPRQYMAALNLDDVTQVNLYQQFLGTKGTNLSAELFTRADLGKESGEYNIFENWAVLASIYGANANKSFYEIQLNEADLQADPSTVQVITPGQESIADQTVFVSNLWKTSYKLTSPEILPTTYKRSPETALPSAGYVSLDDVDITVYSLDDPTSIADNLSIIGVGTTIWVAKVNSYDWGIYRCQDEPGTISSIQDNLNGTSIATFTTYHNLKVGDLIIIKFFDATVDGVYRVLGVPSITSITIAVSFYNSNQTTITSTGLVFYLESKRVTQASDIAYLDYAKDLQSGATVWVDNDGNGHWEVLQKQQPFTAFEIINPIPLVAGSRFGSSLAQTESHFASWVGQPGVGSDPGLVHTYRRREDTSYTDNIILQLNATDVVGYGASMSLGKSNWGVIGAPGSNNGAGYINMVYLVPASNDYKQTQLLLAPDQNFGNANFGYAVAISNDERWMYVSSPNSNRVYAYGRVDVEAQYRTYLSDGITVEYNYSDYIEIDPADPQQLDVFLNNAGAIYGTDYSVTGAGTVLFATAPAKGIIIRIARRNSIQLDQQVYYNILPSSQTGVGTGGVFTVTVTRGVYYPSIISPGGDYAIGDQLTFDYTQICPSGSSANDLIVTITGVSDTGAIESFTQTGSGITNTATFQLNPYLYTANNIYAFTVLVDGYLQRPHIDYEFNNDSNDVTYDITFNTLPPPGAVITVLADTYWMYIDTLPTPDDIVGSAKFGFSLSCTVDGRQVVIGTPYDESQGTGYTGSVYVYDRSVIAQQITDASQTTYAIPTPYTGPIAVLLNGEYLTNTAEFYHGDYTVVGGNIVFTATVQLTVGDILEFETNQFNLVQKIVDDTPGAASLFGYSVNMCAASCSIYTGAPFDSRVLPQAGSVQRNLNQSRVYGVITSTIANPTLTYGATIRINDFVVAAPSSDIADLVEAINSANIPNAIATSTPNLTFIGDGFKKVFEVGSIYSVATSYTTVVYVDDILQVAGVDYTYNATTQQINFLQPPFANSVIKVISGRMTISVKNFEAALPANKLKVLPGVTSTAFDDIGFEIFPWVQEITSPYPTDYAQFGAALSINSNSTNLVVGAPYGTVIEPVIFDGGLTYFDDGSTKFISPIVNSGVAYSYDLLPSANSSIKNPGAFVFGQQIFANTLKTTDQFGWAVSYVTGRLMIGLPGGDVGDSAVNYGQAFVFDNPTESPAWAIIRAQEPAVDTNLINGIYSYDRTLSKVTAYFDFINPLQGKILGAARRNIDYIGAVDPAQYNEGTIHNNGNSWAMEHLGEIWWDTDTVRFIDPSQDNIAYASRRWGQIFPGSRVDIYQWIASSVPPALYTGQGTPLSQTTYTVNTALNKSNIIETTYYFWVRGITTIETGAGKTLSPSAIASYIESPKSSGIPYIATLNSSTVGIYNASSLISAQDTVLHIGYDRQEIGGENNIHQEYQFIADGRPESFLNDTLYRKMQDSFCGVDAAGANVPDPTLSPAEKYGVQFRPRQSMFADRFAALKNYLTRVNYVLSQYPITESRSFNLLNSSEATPTKIIATATECSISGNVLTVGGTINGIFQVGMTVTSNFVNTILTIKSLGTGTGGAGTYILDSTAILSNKTVTGCIGYNQEVANLTELGYQNLSIVPLGYLYLVATTSTQNGLWTIYQVAAGPNLGEKVLNLLRIQNYDTRLYWNHINWYRTGYNKTIQPLIEVTNRTSLDQVTLSEVPIGGSAKVTSNGQGKFEIYLRTDTGWERVGLEDGTIAFSASLWDYPLGNFGFDVEVFDAQYFDQEPVIETRKIIQAINEELLIGDLFIERNSALILMFNFVYSEFTAPEWLMKTSLIDVDHKIRALKPFQIYMQDNQTFVLDYIQEVKPYHVQVREFNLAYYGDDTYPGNLTDFDVPAYWDSSANVPVPQYVSPILLPYDHANTTVQNDFSDSASNTEIWTLDPWKQWYNNYLLGIQSVEIVNNGEGYASAPTVTVTGDCIRQATMTAIINSAGRVVSVTVDDPGFGYTTTAIITLVGESVITARAVAVMGNDLVRSIKTTIKYDRCEYTSTVVDWKANTTYVDGELVRYADTVWSAIGTVNTDEFITADWTLVDAGTLSGADRTYGYYLPTPNEPGRELPLLIDGIDYPGVQVTGPGFNQNTGYDVGNFDINPFDNISISPEGYPTYDYAILDAVYESSYLDPYLGTRPTDINVDGGAYVDTFSSHAPQELVPGAEFDTLDFRVYTTPGSDWVGDGHGFVVTNRKFIYDPLNPVFSFAGMLEYPFTVLLWNVTLGVGIEPYIYDWANYQLIGTPFAYPGDEIELVATGIGGGNQLYLDTYLGSQMIDGNTVIVPFPNSAIYQFAIYDGETPLFEGYNYNRAPQFSTTAIQTVYDPNGSDGTLMYVGSTYKIYVGALVQGPGITSGQTVVAINGPTSVILSASPDSTPYGLISFYNDTGKTVVSFNNTYDDTHRINLCALGFAPEGQITHSYNIPVFSVTIADGNLTYELPPYQILAGTNIPNTVVQRNGVRARPYEGKRYITDYVTLTYELPWAGDYSQGLVSDSDVAVYLDQVQLVLNVDYVVDAYDGSSRRTITLLNPLPPGYILLISVKTAAQYVVSGNQVTFRPDQGLSPQIGDILVFVTWNDPSELGLITEVFVGPTTEGIQVSEGYDETDFDTGTVSFEPGSFSYQTGAVTQTNRFKLGDDPILDPNRLIVTLNGYWLAYGSGYSTDGPYLIVQGPPISPTSVVAVSYFAASVVPGAMAFRIFQDMRGVQATYRITPKTTTELARAVTQTDDVIYLVDATAVDAPEVEKNIFGVITIDGERIMYRSRDLATNSISSLLRGTAGTGNAPHSQGATVYNLGRSNLLPAQFQDYIVSNSFMADGSTTAFVATDIDVGQLDSTSIEEAVEVYVGGIRVTVDYTITADNPVAIEFDVAPPTGVDVTILVRRGHTWYAPGAGTPSDGVPLQETNTQAARFLRGLT